MKLCDNPVGDRALDALLALVRRPSCGSALEELHLQGSALSADACRAVRRTYEPDGLRRLMIFL
eukprot:6880756-Prymnesium_polylepis.1